MQYIGSSEAPEKHISAEICKKNLHTSVKIWQICMFLQDSVQRSLQNPAEKNPADLHRFAKIEPWDYMTKTKVTKLVCSFCLQCFIYVFITSCWAVVGFRQFFTMVPAQPWSWDRCRKQ